VKVERTRCIYPRKKEVSKNTVRYANYLCEVDSNYFVFKRKNSQNNYTEPHRLVPLSAYCDFPNVDLDREQNIVSLCSNCHNLLNYGSTYKDTLYGLYLRRKELFAQIGIVISFEQLLSYY